MIYGTSGACWWVMCSRSSGGAWPAARNGSGRGGVLLFPVRDRRTWTDEMCMSTVGMWGSNCSTQFGRRWGGRGLSTVRWTSGFHRRRWRHGVLLAGVSEDGEGVARSLLRGDVVLLVPLVGAEGQCGVESATRPSGGGMELAGAAGDDVRAR
jgi:hypothetical protein